MNTNVLSILGVSAKEDVISNLLRYCIEASLAFRNAFLANICEVTLPVGGVRAPTRVTTEASGIPDLVIAAETPGDNYLVVLENKLKGREKKGKGREQGSGFFS